MGIWDKEVVSDLVREIKRELYDAAISCGHSECVAREQVAANMAKCLEGLRAAIIEAVMCPISDSDGKATLRVRVTPDLKTKLVHRAFDLGILKGHGLQ
jgi:hypothetical protein